jgi:hypothetical protein
MESVNGALLVDRVDLVSEGDYASVLELERRASRLGYPALRRDSPAAVRPAECVSAGREGDVAAERAGTPLAPITVDIDFFKRYKDDYDRQPSRACVEAVAAMSRAISAGQTIW